jgi:ferredoxin
MSSTSDSPVVGTVRFEIKTNDCISCAACASIAPTIFALDEDGPARMLKQPSTREEVGEVEAAAAACPVGAIVRV